MSQDRERGLPGDGPEDGPVNGGDDRTLAAELALRLLEPAEERAARARADRDRRFRALVAEAEERFASLAEELPETVPSPAVWRRIRRASLPPRRRAEPERVGFWSRLWLWRGLALGSALAATVLAVRPGPPAPPAPEPLVVRVPAEPVADLLGALAAEDGMARFVATYDPLDGRLSVVPAVARDPDGRVPELWIVASSGAVISLGVLDPVRPSAVLVPQTLRDGAASGGLLVVTLEPVGGAPGGVATGPAIAKGSLGRI